MKYKTTFKQLKQAHNLVSVGYCDLQRVLNYESPRAYVSGIYEWYCDIYHFDGFTLMTGYCTQGGIELPYELVKLMESQANEMSREQRKAMLENKVWDFLKTTKG